MTNLDIKRLHKENIPTFLPMVRTLMDDTVEEALLKRRFEAMFDQNYECHGIYLSEALIGVFGLWFATRHYCGKTCEPDHVYILPEHRGNGLGKKVFAWIAEYAKTKGCETAELNTYVSNHSSHKFYMNQGYEILGYHFLKKLD